MYPDFEEALDDLSVKVGIPNLTNESHKEILVKLLRERNVDSAKQLVDEASPIFAYLQKHRPNPKQILKEDDDPFCLDTWKEKAERTDNGLRLFGKYYRGLWD